MNDPLAQIAAFYCYWTSRPWWVYAALFLAPWLSFATVLLLML